MAGRDWAEAEYSRIYWTIVDDEKFVDVFDDDRQWAAYTRLLMAAEQAYPSPASLPRWLADDVLEVLVERRIIELIRGHKYRIVGLKAERDGRLGGHAIGGKKRSEGAERDEFGRFVSAPGAGPSDEPANRPAEPANASNGASGTPVPASSGAPASQLRRDEDEDETSRDETRISSDSSPGARADRPDIAALRARGWKRVTAKQRAILDEVLARHDQTGPAFAATVIEATPRDKDPLAAVMDADRRWQATERQRADAEALAWQATKEKPGDRGASKPERIDAEEGPIWMQDTTP